MNNFVKREAHLIVEPVLAIECAQIIHGEDMTFVIYSKPPHHCTSRHALERLH